MKITCTWKKHSAVSSRRIAGHNYRTDQTTSQLPREAWLGQNICGSWRQQQLDEAKALAKRRDAVVAIELIFQIGDQRDWRHPPTREHPHGKPRTPPPVNPRDLGKAAIESAAATFSRENIVSATVHLDEASGHVHVVVTPIHAGKLQAKHWLNGKAKCAALRKRLCEPLMKQFKCTYTPSNPGGERHDPDKINTYKGPTETLKEVATGKRQIKTLERQLEAANTAAAMAFSRQKKAVLAAADAQKQAKALAKKAQDLEAQASRERKAGFFLGAAHKDAEIEIATRELREQLTQAREEARKAVERAEHAEDRAMAYQERLNRLQPKKAA